MKTDNIHNILWLALAIVLSLTTLGNALENVKEEIRPEKTSAILLTPKEKEFIEKHKPLVFSEISWPPLSIVDDPEKFQGIIADYLNLITGLSDIRFEYQKSITGNLSVTDVYHIAAKLSKR